ncbi:hypothetical protein TrRE_jg13125 [Triparma retinervis]|uniref:Serine aminopeptidase S33 domain-containing protein n=1 Tax=Triparma retinervis TaxID=2557542 RepID=A0A9W7DMK0_9STRA|nr:hypothetical protein TrRE_jg13125 [Triparma retinervis]
MSYYSMAKQGYAELVSAIIRPPRSSYTVEDLGPPSFRFSGQTFTRTDFRLDTTRGMGLECSHWEPVIRKIEQIPCVIYMHGNSSSRVEALGCLSYLLSLGVSVFAFDFAGSGMSDGEYVSLGWYEREDLAEVINHLRATNVVSLIALWGRSMGAATALMHGQRDPSIACMICDSPFTSLSTLASEMVERGRSQGLWAPNMIVSVVIKMISTSVKKKANFKVDDINPLKHVGQSFIPCLFIAGEDDNFIPPSHSQALHAAYAGDKNIIVVDGDHNSPRPKFMFDSACVFLSNCLMLDPAVSGLPIEDDMNLSYPPWYLPGRTTMKDFFGSVFGSGGNTANPNRPASVNSPTCQARARDGAGEILFADIPTPPPPPLPSLTTVADLPPDPPMSALGFNEQNIGMTAERQQNIQDSVVKMLSGNPTRF